MGGGSSKVYPTIEQAEAPGQAPKPGKKDLRGLELAKAKELKESEAKLKTEKTNLTTERDALIKKRDELQKSKDDLERTKKDLDTKINDMQKNQKAIEAALKGDSSKLQEELNEKTQEFEARMQTKKTEYEADLKEKTDSIENLNTKIASLESTLTKNTQNAAVVKKGLDERIADLETKNTDLEKTTAEKLKAYNELEGNMLAQKASELAALQRREDQKYQDLKDREDFKYGKLDAKFNANEQKMSELENKYRDLVEAFMMDDGAEEGAADAKHMDKLPIALQRFSPLNADPRLKGLKREIDRLTKDADVFARSKRLEAGKQSASEQEQLLNRVAQAVVTPHLLAELVLTDHKYYRDMLRYPSKPEGITSMKALFEELLHKGYKEYALEGYKAHEFALADVIFSSEADRRDAILNRCISDKLLNQKVKEITKTKLMDTKLKRDAKAVSSQLSQMQAIPGPQSGYVAPTPAPQSGYVAPTPAPQSGSASPTPAPSAPQSVPESAVGAVPAPTSSDVAPLAPTPETTEVSTGVVATASPLAGILEPPPTDSPGGEEQASPTPSPPPSPPALEAEDSAMFMNLITPDLLQPVPQTPSQDGMTLLEDLRLFTLLDLSGSVTVDSTVTSQKELAEKIDKLSKMERESLCRMLDQPNPGQVKNEELVTLIKDRHKVANVYQKLSEAKVKELDPAEKQTILKNLLVETYHDESFERLLKADELTALQLELKTNNAKSLAKKVNDVEALQEQVKRLEGDPKARATPLFRAFKRLMDDKKAKTHSADRARSPEDVTLLKRLMQSLGATYAPEDYKAISMCLVKAREEEATNVAKTRSDFVAANKIGEVKGTAESEGMNVAGWIIEFKDVSTKLEASEKQMAKLAKTLNQMIRSGASGVDHQKMQMEQAREEEVKHRKRRSDLMKKNPFALLELKVMEVQEIIDHELHARLSQDKIVQQLQDVIYQGNENFLQVYTSTWNTIKSSDHTGVQALKKAIDELGRLQGLQSGSLKQELGEGAGAAIKYSIKPPSAGDEERIGVQVVPYAAAGFAALHLDAINTRMKVTEWLEKSQIPNWEAPAPIKSLLRIAEKVTLKRGEDIKPSGEFIPVHYDARSVCDVVRDMFTCHDFAACAETLLAFIKAHKAGEIKIVRFKDRFFKDPSPGGWRDMMLNYTVAGSNHICEAQIAHRSLVVARKDLPGHAIYNRVRNASELLEKLFGFPDVTPEKMPDYVMDLKEKQLQEKQKKFDDEGWSCLLDGTQNSGFCAVCLQAFHLDPAFLATSWVGSEPKKMKPFKLKAGFEPEIFCMPVKTEADIARMLVKAGGMKLMSKVTIGDSFGEKKAEVLEEAGIEKTDVYANSMLTKCNMTEADLKALDGMCFLDAKQMDSPLVDTDFEGLIHLVKTKSALSQITLLSLDGNTEPKITEKSWKGLGDLLTDFMPHLASLWLPNCDITDAGLIAIVKGLSKRTNKIKHLDVSCNKLKSTAMQAIANGLSTGLSECEQLVLHSQGDQDQDKSLMALAAAISSGKELKLKNISIDVISDAGIGAKMLKKAMASAEPPIVNLFDA